MVVTAIGTAFVIISSVDSKIDAKIDKVDAKIDKVCEQLTSKMDMFIDEQRKSQAQVKEKVDTLEGQVQIMRGGVFKPSRS